MGIYAHKMAYFWMSPIYFLTNFHSAIWKSLVRHSRSSLHISMFKSLNKRGAFKDTKSSFRLLSFPIPIRPLKQRRLWKAPCIAWAVVYKSEKEAANSPNETCACCCSARSRQGSAKLFEIPRLILILAHRLLCDKQCLDRNFISRHCFDMYSTPRILAINVTQWGSNYLLIYEGAFLNATCVSQFCKERGPWEVWSVLPWVNF